MRLHRLIAPLLGVLILSITNLGTTILSGAEAKGPLKFQVQLIWGTNDDKPAEKNLKEVDASLIERLKTVFKWKNYFEVSRKNVVASTGPHPKTKLSEKCEIEVHHLGDSKVEVVLWGEGKCVKTVKRSVTPGNLIVIAGDDKNDTAWFLVLNPN